MKKITRKLALFMAVLLLLAGFNSTNVSQAASVDRVRVYALNVGHGDCYIIELVLDSGPSKFVLVDTGNAQKERIQQFIKDKGIKRFEYVILTHLDSDHAKQLKDLISGVTVGKYLMRRYSTVTLQSSKSEWENVKQYETDYSLNTQKNYNNVKTVIMDKEGNYDKMVFPNRQSNTDMKIDNIKFTFLNKTESSYYAVKTKNKNNLDLATNDDSLVFRITSTNVNHSMKALLFTGDIRPNAMAEYTGNSNLFKNVGFFTFPHHGILTGNDVNKESIRSNFFDKLVPKDANGIPIASQLPVAFISSPNNTEIINEKNKSIANYNKDKTKEAQKPYYTIDDIGKCFDVASIKKFTYKVSDTTLKKYFRTSNLVSGQIAMKYSINLITGASSTSSYPDNITLTK